MNLYCLERIVLFFLLLNMAVPRIWAQSISSWVTSGNQNKLFQLQAPAAFGASKAGARLTLDDSQTFQSIDGFGYTLTEGSAEVINSLNATVQENLLNELFNSTTGLGISVIRISIGASDLSSSNYSYNDVAGDVSMSKFSLAGPDLTHLIPLLKKNILINPKVKWMGSPWSPPKWMKSNGSWIGGQLKPEYYAAYASYFVKYIETMKALGIDIWAITTQNEPENPKNNPSLSMTASEQLTFINDFLGPAFEAAKIKTKIIAFDHNCDNTSYPIQVANGSKYVDGSAFHLYLGTISAMSTVHMATNKDVYFTEQYTGVGGGFGGDLIWHIQNVMVGSLNNWSKTALEWNLATDTQYGPHTDGGCTTCLGAITVKSNSILERNVSYYIVAHMSKVIKPGAVRIATHFHDPHLVHVAVTNLDGSIGMVILNTLTVPLSFEVEWKGKFSPYKLEAGEVVSILWSPTTDIHAMKTKEELSHSIQKKGILRNIVGKRLENQKANQKPIRIRAWSTN